jgi:hypothetical protein
MKVEKYRCTIHTNLFHRKRKELKKRFFLGARTDCHHRKIIIQISIEYITSQVALTTRFYTIMKGYLLDELRHAH